MWLVYTHMTSQPLNVLNYFSWRQTVWHWVCLCAVTCMQKYATKCCIHPTQYTHVHPHNFWGSLASSCQCRSWQTGFCCVCVSKEVVWYRLEGFTNWAPNKERTQLRERERDTKSVKESDRHGKERGREYIYTCVCVCLCRREGLNCPRLNHMWRWQGLRTPCCWGNETKQQAQIYKL